MVIHSSSDVQMRRFDHISGGLWRFCSVGLGSEGSNWSSSLEIALKLKLRLELT